MQFLRTLFWAVLAVVAAIFSFNNWKPVTVNLWAGIQADAKLPVLLVAAFLAGLVPTLLIGQARRWGLKRRLDAAERSLVELRAPTIPATDPVEPGVPAVPPAFAPPPPAPPQSASPPPASTVVTP